MVGAPAVESLQTTLASGSTTTPAATSGTSASASATTSAGAATPSATPTAAAAAPVGVTGTFDGSTVQTQYGPMQVRVAIDNGTITEVTPLQLTNEGGRSVMISNQAAPILRSEVLAAQSAQVQNVSGATYTTQGYLQSLQSALDAAHF
jgi:uncharacterized protein with FMN-binding domain